MVGSALVQRGGSGCFHAAVWVLGELDTALARLVLEAADDLQQRHPGAGLEGLLAYLRGGQYAGMFDGSLGAIPPGQLRSGLQKLVRHRLLSPALEVSAAGQGLRHGFAEGPELFCRILRRGPRRPSRVR
ncbi:MAG: hypothetical protein KatS3mg102_1998 [Planctomycetota bacterium]|nr:MAG: hypothetical protein KatS3mg102_1998 [Planctomycetota bacterium]